MSKIVYFQNDVLNIRDTLLYKQYSVLRYVLRSLYGQMKEIDKIQKPKGTMGFFNKLVASIAPSKYHACRVTYAFGWSTQIMSEFELKKVIDVASLEIQIV